LSACISVCVWPAYLLVSDRLYQLFDSPSLPLIALLSKPHTNLERARLTRSSNYERNSGSRSQPEKDGSSGFGLYTVDWAGLKWPLRSLCLSVSPDCYINTHTHTHTRNDRRSIHFIHPRRASLHRTAHTLSDQEEEEEDTDQGSTTAAPLVRLITEERERERPVGLPNDLQSNTKSQLCSTFARQTSACLFFFFSAKTVGLLKAFVNSFRSSTDFRSLHLYTCRTFSLQLFPLSVHFSRLTIRLLCISIRIT
jgi:hypothetical protein